MPLVIIAVFVVTGLFFAGCSSSKNEGGKDLEVLEIEKILQNTTEGTLIRLKDGRVVFVTKNNLVRGSIWYATAKDCQAGDEIYEELAPKIASIQPPFTHNGDIEMKYAELAGIYLTQDFRKKGK